MTEAENVTLSEIVCDTGSERRQIFLQTELKNGGEEGFDLIVLDGSTVWEGKITENALDRQSEALKMDFNTYVKETKMALTKSTMSDMTFECIFKPVGASSGRLTWKKVPAQSIKFNLGSVDLKKVTNQRETLTTVLGQCISSTQSLQSQILALQSLNERLTQERQNALKRLDKCVSAKDELEKDLFSKFVAVLNSKKEKIRELENNPGLMDEDDPGEISPANRSSPVPSTSKKNMKRSSQRDHNTSNGSHEDEERSTVYDNDTDEEGQSPPPRKKPAGKAPKVHNKLRLEASLVLGDDEEDGSQTSPVPRRARRQPVAKKETPAKPVLPRVSSISSVEKDSLAGSRRSSLRKSGSGKSNKSSDNLDPDDLMENF